MPTTKHPALIQCRPLFLLLTLAISQAQTKPQDTTQPADSQPVQTQPANTQPASSRAADSQPATDTQPTGDSDVGNLIATPTTEPTQPEPAANPSNPPESNGDHDIDKHVLCLAKDSHNKIWVGTEANGVWCFDPTGNPESRWKQFTIRDGLGDNGIWALATDRLGRIWAGHLNHGLSVYNGEKWQNYEAAAGLSAPNSLAGPIGERVNAFAASPLDGDMWVATSAGIARYSLAKDAWTYFTRADGLPSDQISTLAFDKSGQLFVGTQCDGIAIAKPGDNYQSWTRVKGPDILQPVAAGRGLPSNQINQILVATNGDIYVATLGGIARSVDHGATWLFMRGTDWTRKVAMQNTPTIIKSPPDPKWPPYVLKEDHVTCLAEDDAGRIFIGNRDAGYQILVPADPRDRTAPSAGLATAGTLLSAPVIKAQASGKPPPMVMALLPFKGQVFVALYGGGLQTLDPPGAYTAKPVGTPSAISTAPKPPLPASATAPTVAELHALADKATLLAAGPHPPVVYIGDDWRTQGDWVNHYGRQYSVLGAALGPFDEFVTSGPAYYRVLPLMGANRRPDDGIRRWIHSLSDPHNLYDPALGRRNETEWDDHGETYLLPIDGPDMHFQVTLPAGISRVSIYFCNQLGRYNAERWRDLDICVRRIPAELGGRGDAAPLKGPLPSDPPALPPAPPALIPNAAVPASWNNSPILARTRVKDFFGGVYKQFAVTGPGAFDFAIRRNYGYNTICSAVFIDRLSGPATSLDNAAPLILEGPAYEPPSANFAPTDIQSEQAVAAFGLWTRLDSAQANPAIQQLDFPARVLAYRALNPASPLAENWRWSLRLWTPGDRAHFQTAMADVWQYQMVNYPELHQGLTVDVLPYKAP